MWSLGRAALRGPLTAPGHQLMGLDLLTLGLFISELGSMDAGPACFSGLLRACKVLVLGVT